MRAIAGIVVAFTIGLAASGPYSSQLTDAQLTSIATLLDSDRSTLNLEQEEMRYQDTVRAQTIADLAQIYAPENAERLQIAYVSFTSEAAKEPAADRGYGLHIVKRLDLPLAGGGSKTIYVNEQWREDKASKGIVLPDEIRIQTQVASGPRRVKGSDRLYLFDSIRVAWNAFNRDPQLARHTIYKRVNGKNEFKPTRSSVSAPFSCATCHGPSNRFADTFLAKGEARNYEAIVQDRYFQLPPSDMRGYKEYVAYLEKSGVSDDMISRVKQKLDLPQNATDVPGLFDLLSSTGAADGIVWLSEDSQLHDARPDREVQQQQGVYRDAGGRWRIDALEDIIEGKYVWWEPIPVIP
jgi:hypothetical protein